MPADCSVDALPVTDSAWLMYTCAMFCLCVLRSLRQQGEFCWICMGDWGEHGSTTGGYYKCNKYEAKEGEGDNDVAKAKAELDRYLHYYKR